MRRRLIVLGAAVLAVLLVWIVWFSPVLAVRSVQVDGAGAGLSGSVRAVADDEVGEPMLRADLAGVAARVDRIAEVRSVEVTRGWPSTLTVTVRERTPVVVVARGGQRQLVDSTGAEYAEATAADARRLPVVQLDAKASGEDAAAVARVMAAIPEGDRDQVSDLRLDSIGQVGFVIDGLRVSWGSSGKSTAKGKALKTMRPIAKKEGSSRLDLSTPGRPVLS